MNGKFITIEGPDGAGKSSAVPALVNALRTAGYKVHQTREPGGSEVGEKIRAILLNEEMCSKAELLLFAASRAEHIEKVIKPKMAEGYIVISDRFSDSSYAYQGAARGMIREVLELEKFVHQGFEPDYTLFFDTPFEICQKRLSLRTGKQDRFDKEIEEFRRKVYAGYKARFEQKHYRMHRIDSSKKMSRMIDNVVLWVENVFVPENPIEGVTNE